MTSLLPARLVVAILGPAISDRQAGRAWGSPSVGRKVRDAAALPTAVAPVLRAITAHTQVETRTLRAAAR